MEDLIYSLHDFNANLPQRTQRAQRNSTNENKNRNCFNDTSSIFQLKYYCFSVLVLFFVFVFVLLCAPCDINNLLL